MVSVADTAYSIALIRQEEAALPPEQRLFEDPYAKIFVAAGEHAREATERFVALPFFREGIRLRTRFNDDVVRGALREGTRQVVLMGAGFDARGLRIAELAAVGAVVFEVDFAEQLAKKRALLAAAEVPIPPWIRYIACDFTQPDFEHRLEAALVGAGFRAGGGAVFVWEGVVPYIGQAAIDRSLAFMSRAGGAGSRVVFDLAEGFFDPDDAATRTARHGFSSCEEVSFDALWRRWLAGEPHPAAAIMRGVVARV